jgi:hypothetical protein
MNVQDEQYLLKWALLIGFVLGGLPTLPISLTAPSPLLVIPFGPVIMSLLMYGMFKYMKPFAGKGLTVGKEALAGAGAAAIYIVCMMVLFRLVLGSGFWTLRMLILQFYGLPFLLIGTITGIIFGHNLNAVVLKKVRLKHDKLSLPVCSAIVFVCYILLPIIDWFSYGPFILLR